MSSRCPLNQGVPHLFMKEEELVCLNLTLADGQRVQLDPTRVELQFVLRTSISPALSAHPERHVTTERDSMNNKEEVELFTRK